MGTTKIVKEALWSSFESNLKNIEQQLAQLAELEARCTSIRESIDRKRRAIECATGLPWDVIIGEKPATANALRVPSSAVAPREESDRLFRGKVVRQAVESVLATMAKSTFTVTDVCAQIEQERGRVLTAPERKLVSAMLQSFEKKLLIHRCESGSKTRLLYKKSRKEKEPRKIDNGRVKKTTAARGGDTVQGQVLRAIAHYEDNNPASRIDAASIRIYIDAGDAAFLEGRNPNAVSGALSGLKRRGLIVAREGDQFNRPQYSLTTTGRKALS